MTDIDISPEAVAKMLEAMRGGQFNVVAAADMIEALAARVAEMGAERDECKECFEADNEAFAGALLKLEAAEARVAELEVECDRHCDAAQHADGLRDIQERRAKKAEAEVARLREALAWYGNLETYELRHEVLPCDCCTDIFKDIERDEGQRARAALGETP